MGRRSPFRIFKPPRRRRKKSPLGGLDYKRPGTGRLFSSGYSFWSGKRVRSSGCFTCVFLMVMLILLCLHLSIYL